MSMFASDSPFSGTWKLNPKEGEAIISTARVEADNGHLKLEQDFVDAKGKSSTVKFDAKFDSKDYPSSGDDGFDSIKTPLGTCPSRKTVILRLQMDLEPARSIWSSRLQHLPQNASPQAE
jgi:hypothetical protein